MKILEYTSTKLTICANRPVRHWIVGLVFTLVGLMAIAGPEQMMTFTCDRLTPNQGSCQLVHSSLLFSNEIAIPLENLQQATIEANLSSANQSYRIALVTESGQIPLMNDSSSNLEEQQLRVNKVNEFLQNPERQSLSIKEDNRLFSYIFGGIFIGTALVGSGVITQEFTCKFDKSLGSLTLIKKGWGWTRKVKQPISDIIGLQVGNPKKREEKNSYKISLVLSSGKRIGLTSGNEPDRQQTKTLINCLTTFLDIGISNRL